MPTKEYRDTNLEHVRAYEREYARRMREKKRLFRVFHQPNEFSPYAGQRHRGAERTCRICHPDVILITRKHPLSQLKHLESRLRA